MFRSYLWGCFLLLKHIEQEGSVRLLLCAAAAWFAAALLLLTAASLILALTGLGSSVLGWISSAISFFSAFAAGAALRRKGRRAGFLQALLTAVLLIVILLSLGYLVSDRTPDPSGVLSVVSFTFAGIAASSLLFPSRQRARGKRRSGSVRVHR